MAEKKIDSPGSEPEAAADAERKEIAAYLSSEAWEARLAEARARREKVLSARRAAGDRDRPAIRPVPSETVGFTAASLRPQAPEARQGTAADCSNGAAVASSGENRFRRRTATGIAGFAALIVFVAAAWLPLLRPLSESVFGASGVPDPAVDIPGLVSPGSDGEAPAAATAQRIDERRVAEAPSPALPVLPEPRAAPSLSRAKDGADLAKPVPTFPPPPSGERIAPPSSFAIHSDAELDVPAAPALARLGSDETSGMAALASPGLDIDGPVFPARPAERAAPDVKVPPTGPQVAGAAPRRLSLPAIDGTARSGSAAPRKPAAVEPYLPVSPSGGTGEGAVAASANAPAGSRSVAVLREWPINRPTGAAELTLDGIVGRESAEKIAANLTPTLSLPSMPLRPQSGSAAPSALPAVGAPLLAAIGPDFPAVDRAGEPAIPAATNGENTAAPRPSKPSAPAAEDDVAALRQSTLSKNPARYRLTLHAAAEDMAAALHDRLIGIGFTTIDVTVSSLAAQSTSVFFFHDEDASAAAQLAAMLGGEAISAVGLVPSPPVGALDIHVGG